MTLHGGIITKRPLCYTTDGRLVVAPCGNEIRVYGAKSGEHIATLRGHSAEVTAVAQDPSNSKLVGVISISSWGSSSKGQPADRGCVVRSRSRILYSGQTTFTVWRFKAAADMLVLHPAIGAAVALEQLIRWHPQAVGHARRLCRAHLARWGASGVHGKGRLQTAGCRLLAMVSAKSLTGSLTSTSSITGL